MLLLLIWIVASTPSGQTQRITRPVELQHLLRLRPPNQPHRSDYSTLLSQPTHPVGFADTSFDVPARGREIVWRGKLHKRIRVEYRIRAKDPSVALRSEVSQKEHCVPCDTWPIPSGLISSSPVYLLHCDLAGSRRHSTRDFTKFRRPSTLATPVSSSEQTHSTEARLSIESLETSTTPDYTIKSPRLVIAQDSSTTVHSFTDSR